MSSDTPIYLDHAATTPLDERVLAAMQPYFITNYYNPSATYSAARRVHVDLETARAQAAHWLGARPSEIIFTAGATEANNSAIHGVMRRYPEAQIVVSAIEHESVLRPAQCYPVREVSVNRDGIINRTDLERAIDDNTVLVSIMYANNEVGTVQPLRDISRLLVSIRKQRLAAGNTLPLYFHSDAAQAGNYLDLHTARLGVDLMSLNGSKIYGPKQSGLLYVKAGMVLDPLIQGGGQERNLRPGTENVAGSIGLASALNLVQQDRHSEARRLQQQFIAALEALPSVTINGSLSRRLPSNVHITIAGQDNERLLIGLDELGIQAAAGSACSASDEEPSHVLRAMRLSDAEARASLRFTMGRSTTDADLSRAVATLAQLLE
jgi:cysteine desulfurase